ncbi:hypothetical protein EON73_04445 [bacterium]|nr:MAG: hypothetical protein EON73_04445 [bacterium]
MMQRIIQVFLLFSLPISVYSQARSFKTDIPVSKNDQYNMYYNYTQKFQEQLSIKPLKNGSEDTVIRIWYDYALFKYKEMYELSKNNNKWRVTHYAFWTESQGPSVDRTITRKQVEAIDPKTSAENLLLQLKKLEIETLPNMNNIPHLSDTYLDGTSYCFEVSTRSNYRFYTYHLPEKFLEFRQAKLCVAILNTLEAELDIKKRQQEIIALWTKK